MREEKKTHERADESSLSEQRGAVVSAPGSYFLPVPRARKIYPEYLALRLV